MSMTASDARGDAKMAPAAMPLTTNALREDLVSWGCVYAIEHTAVGGAGWKWVMHGMVGGVCPGGAVLCHVAVVPCYDHSTNVTK
jgi:hypothetical protein